MPRRNFRRNHRSYRETRKKKAKKAKTVRAHDFQPETPQTLTAPPVPLVVPIVNVKYNACDFCHDEATSESMIDGALACDDCAFWLNNRFPDDFPLDIWVDIPAGTTQVPPKEPRPPEAATLIMQRHVDSLNKTTITTADISKGEWINITLPNGEITQVWAGNTELDEQLDRETAVALGL